MNCPRCGEPMTNGICDNCGFPMTRIKSEYAGRKLVFLAEE